MLADDTSMLLDGSENSLDNCLNVLKYLQIYQVYELTMIRHKLYG